MTDLLQKLTDLEEVSSKLEPSKEERAHYLGKAQEWSDKFISEIDQVDSYSNKQPDAKKLAIGTESKSIEELLNLYTAEVSLTGPTST